MLLDIESTLSDTFPGLQALELKLSNLSIKESTVELDQLIKQFQEKIRNSTRSLVEIKNEPVFRSYRDFFWKVGIDPTKTRPAGEALTRRVLEGKDFPRINTLVDSYNLASVVTSIAIAAFDLSKISQSALLMRRAKSGEKFLGIGMSSETILRGVEIVIEDCESKK